MTRAEIPDPAALWAQAAGELAEWLAPTGPTAPRCRIGGPGPGWPELASEDLCRGWPVDLLFGRNAAVAKADVMATMLAIRRRDGSLVRLLPNAVQGEFAKRRRRRNIILKARQVGMTTWIAARFFMKTLLVPGTVTVQVAHTQESAQQIFRIVQRFLRYAPAGLAPFARTARANVRELAFAHNDSRYIVDTAGNPHAGRGLTIHNLHASEVAMWPHNPRETMAALLAAVPPGGCVDIESTPHGAGGFFHEQWVQSARPQPPDSAFCIHPSAFVPHFFPWWMEPAYQVELLPGEEIALSEEESSLAAAHGLSPAQIKFRRQLRLHFGDLAAQEFAETPESCFLLSGRPVFDVAAIDARLAELPERVAPTGSGRQGRGAADANGQAMIEWHPPQPGRSYVIGADVAGGGPLGDFSAALVIDSETGLQCAEILARWPIARFAQELAVLGSRYNQALLAVERNNQGHAVLHALHYQHNYPRLFHHAGPDRVGTKGRGAPRFRDDAGWLTNEQTKTQAIGHLDRMLRQAPHTFHSRRMLEQCRGYSYLGGGQCGALPGMHDDLVMAAAIALAVRAGGGHIQLASLAL